MSKYPKIYAFCDAGCRWETVHMEDFQKAASIVEHTKNEDGFFHLKTGILYKIRRTTPIVNNSYGFSVRVRTTLDVGDKIKTVESQNLYGAEGGFVINENGAYREYLTVKIITAVEELGTYKCVIEIDGVARIFVVGYEHDIAAILGCEIIVEGAKKCYRVNESAEILAHVDYDKVNEHLDEVIDDTLTQVYGVGTAVVGNTLKIWCDERFNPVTVNEGTNTLVFR